MATLADKGYKISKNILFSVLTSKAAKLLGKPGKIGFLLHDSYQKLTVAGSKESGFVQIKEVMFSFIRLVKSYTSGEYRDISTKSIVIGIASLLYLVMPIDIIPDFIPGLGLLDDLSLLAWFIKAFQTEINKYRDWEKARVIMPS